MDLTEKYQSYIDCLNKRDLTCLCEHIDDNVIYNGSEIGLKGYTNMLAGNFRDIPDLRFNVELLITENTYVGSRLRFDCHPKGEFMGLQINGKHIVFYENVFYQFRDHKIAQVWSVIDKTGIQID